MRIEEGFSFSVRFDLCSPDRLVFTSHAQLCAMINGMLFKLTIIVIHTEGLDWILDMRRWT